MMEKEVRVRLAPSPTGYFHIGTARTALFNYLFAKKAGGKFILRIEDTDKERSKEEFVLDITNGLSWLGISWDEGPFCEGPYGPYYQSKKTDRYKECVKKLVDQGLAYENEGAIWFKIPETIDLENKDVVVDDMIRGKVTFKLSEMKDFVIVKSDGTPIFHLAVVVDDFDMKISHVIRGEEHLSNTPRHILLQKALNFPTPAYAHLPLIMNPDRSKMSKRKDPVSVTNDFKGKGYLPEAMINFMTLLGWSPVGDKDIFSMEDLLSDFDISRVGKSSAIFNQQKLDWLNGYYIRQLPLGDLAKLCQPFLAEHKIDATGDYIIQVVSLVQERLKHLDEIYDLTAFMFTDLIDVSKELLLSKAGDLEKTKLILEKTIETFENEEFAADSLEEKMRQIATDLEIPLGAFFQTIRVATCGSDVSPPLLQTIAVLGRDRTIARLKNALKLV